MDESIVNPKRYYSVISMNFIELETSFNQLMK